jgi:hypothetical protein
VSKRKGQADGQLNVEKFFDLKMYGGFQRMGSPYGECDVPELVWWQFSFCHMGVILGLDIINVEQLGRGTE